MASKKKFVNLPATPRTFKELRSLSLKDLKLLCLDANIPLTGVGRNALEILLAGQLGICSLETNLKPRQDDHLLDGKQMKEFGNLTPSAISKLTDWTKSVERMPDIDIQVVKKYLINNNSKQFNKDNLRTYKLSRSYQHIEAGHICNVAFNELKTSMTFCIVKASCLPSQSGDDAKIKYLHIILDKLTGEPYGGLCTCTVGLTQACSHIGALLFLLADVVARGQELPQNKSVTEDLCRWADPKGLLPVADEFGLSLNRENITVNVGDKPEFTCTTTKQADFLFRNPLQWVQVGRDNKVTVISSLGKVEDALKDDFNVTLVDELGSDQMSIKLSFKQGIKNSYDGYFECWIVDKQNQRLTSKSVEVHVIRMMEKMSFTFGGTKLEETGISAYPIRLKEGTYGALCKAERSNPKADVKIFLDKVEQTVTTTSIMSMENTSVTDPPQAFNVQSVVDLAVNPIDTDKKLKCVAMVNNDPTTKKEIQFKLEVYRELKWETNTPAIFGKDVMLNCTFTNPRHSCKQCSYRWYSENDRLLAFEDIISSDKSKYRTDIQEREGGIIDYLLIIEHFGISDLNMSYTCSFGFQTFTKNLLKNLNRFEYHPTNDSINMSFSIKDQVLNVNVEFREVFPVPRCYVYVKDLNITANLYTDVEEVGLFKRVSLAVKYKFKHAECGGILHMFCFVGSTDLELIKTDIHFLCSSNMTSESQNYMNEVILPIICTSIPAVLVITVVLLVVLRIRRKQSFIRKGQNECINVRIEQFGRLGNGQKANLNSCQPLFGKTSHDEQ